MVYSFRDFLKSKHPKVNSFIKNAKSQATLDRLFNAVEKTKIQHLITIPGFETLTSSYSAIFHHGKLITGSELSKESTLSVNLFVDKLLHIACHELLDDKGQLDTVIVEKLDLRNYDTPPYQGNEEYYRNKLIQAFALDVIQRLSGTEMFEAERVKLTSVMVKRLRIYSKFTPANRWLPGFQAIPC